MGLVGMCGIAFDHRLEKVASKGPSPHGSFRARPMPPVCQPPFALAYRRPLRGGFLLPGAPGGPRQARCRGLRRQPPRVPRRVHRRAHRAAVYHRCANGDAEDVQWMRASASMPLVSRVVEVGGMEFLDGGLSDSIPIAWAHDAGYGRNVVVLTQPRPIPQKKERLGTTAEDPVAQGSRGLPDQAGSGKAEGRASAWHARHEEPNRSDPSLRPRDRLTHRSPSNLRSGLLRRRLSARRRGIDLVQQ